MIKNKPIPQWKIDEINHLVDLLKNHKNIAIVEVANINDLQIQTMRKILRGKAIFRMSKKSLQIRAIEQHKNKSKKKNLDELANNILSQSSLVFTNLDLFELKKIFLDNEWMVPAKPNEITPVDIWVPEGDTGLPTGQVISELNMTLRLPTKIMNDTIHIRETTRTHKSGDLVTIKHAAVLKKLGIAPIKSLIKILFAWNDGEIIPKEILYLDLEQFKQKIVTGYREALGILFEMPFLQEDMIEDYIQKAVSNANILNTMVFGGGIPASMEEEKPIAEKKEQEELEEEEKESSVGIGGLFG